MTVVINGDYGMTTPTSVFTDSSGNVGIGTSSPGYKLDVQSGSTAIYARLKNDNGSVLFETVSGGANRITSLNSAGNASQAFAFNGSGGTEWVRIDTSGNVGIGTSSPTTKLDVKGTAQINFSNASPAGALNLGDSFHYISASSADDYITYATYTSGGHKFGNWNGSTLTERARIDSSGNVFVGKTTSSLSVKGWVFQGDTSGIGFGSTAFDMAGTTNEVFNYNNTGTGTYDIAFRYQNSVKGYIRCTSTTVSFTNLSDYRLKNTIEPMTGALEKVALLKPCTYKWNSDGSDGQGFIAHELQEVCPDAVTGEKDAVDADGNPRYQGIDTSFLVATLTAAIQEQQAIIEQLRADVEALKAA